VRIYWRIASAIIVTLGPLTAVQAQQRLNPVVALLEQKKPVFGLYAPANPRGRRGATPAPDAPAPRTPAQLAELALAQAPNDYLFDGSMERNFDAAFPTFVEFVAGAAAAPLAQRRAHPLVVKVHKIAADPASASDHIAKQLNLGVSGIVFVGVESAAEVRHGLAAMRFRARGGTRPDDVGSAPAYWGLSEKEYREKADLWPLDPRGELVNFTIVESKEGLARVREIAAVEGIGVLFPGAGTLGGVFSTIDSTTTPPRRVRDDKAWEAAIQQVLAACREFNVPCGYPANTPDVMEERLKQGFSVFVIGWGENGFRTVEAGLKASGRTASNR
jgi:4-hydroxy-2-oxoheptanedioate aldolase